jgi:hypothetical protein
VGIHPATLQRCVTQGVTGGIPTQSVGTMKFFCFDWTWKWVLATLVDKADCVLMDLRAYTSKREGCTHELSVLATKPHLDRLVILFDKNTEKEAVEHILAASTTKIVWIDSQTSAKKLQEQVLGALLGS